MVAFETVRSAVEDAGFLMRGGFHPAGDDTVPGTPATLVLVGNAGPAMWDAFSAARRDEAAPLDSWTRRTLDPVAAAFGATAVYPFDGPPHHPFQQWAKRSEAVHPAPIGALIHPDYGLWHAYRGALLFNEPLDLPTREVADSPCSVCKARFCMRTCPVQAFIPGRYDVASCTGHLGGPAGLDCLEKGCKARRSCPIGLDYLYGPDQMRFHMERFLEAYGP